MLGKEKDYVYIREYMHEKAGVTLGDDKDYLIDARLKPVIKTFDVEDLNALVEVLKKGKEVYICESVVDALTTHETYFFRDIKPFVLLREKLLPEIIERNKDTKKISIWSAACSSGQELYSICILLHELLPKGENWSLNLIGTDISQGVVDKAKAGKYFEHEVKRGLSERQVNEYFVENDGKWKIKLPFNINPEFKIYNLLDDFSKLGKFDLILLRNVLIYFEADKRTKILNGINKALEKDGYLFLGSAESPRGYIDCFKRVTDNNVSYFVKK